MNRTRLDAEQIRDSMLAVSGDIDLQMGGPSVRPFQYKHDHSPVYDHARHDPDAPGNSRRSVYRFVVRSVPDPFMDALDCPDPSLLTPRRNVTTTALQALAMLNDPVCCEAGGPVCSATGAQREKTDGASGSGLPAYVRPNPDWRRTKSGCGLR
jgi:hypothetical protein